MYLTTMVGEAVPFQATTLPFGCDSLLSLSNLTIGWISGSKVDIVEAII